MLMVMNFSVKKPIFKTPLRRSQPGLITHTHSSPVHTDGRDGVWGVSSNTARVTPLSQTDPSVYSSQSVRPITVYGRGAARDDDDDTYPIITPRPLTLPGMRLSYFIDKLFFSILFSSFINKK